MRPFSVVENSGFKKMIEVLDQRYDLPSRTHFAESVIPEIFKSVKHEVEMNLKCAEFISLTTDAWTSRATESYNTVTAHFIDTDWKMINYVLMTRKMNDSHTAENLGEMLNEVSVEWQLTRNNSNQAVTTDNASNIVNAVKIANFQPHIRCFAHTLNLATQRGINISQVDRLLGRIRRIVTFFHKSNIACEILKSKQKLLNIEQHKLIGDVATRWNSSYDMVVRFLEQQPAIEAVLLTKEIRQKAKDINTLSESDVTAAEDLVKVLAPLKKVTTTICSETNPTVSMIHPLKEMLLRQLEVEDKDSAIIKSVKTAVSADLRPRYTDPIILEFLHESSFLDPRFHTLPYIDEEKKLQVYSSLTLKTLSLYKQIKSEPQSGEPVDNNGSKSLDAQPNPPLPDVPGLHLPGMVNTDNEIKMELSNDANSEHLSKRSSTLDDLFGDVFVTKVEPGKSTFELIESEITTYKNEPNIPLRASPLLWWKNNQNKFPYLSHSARKYLSIQATSVASERVFSSAGDVVSSQRACLAPEHVDQLIFLK